MAFQEVRIQQSVIEFILNHAEQIFSADSPQVKAKEGLMLKSMNKLVCAADCGITDSTCAGPSLVCAEKYATLPISGHGGPMKLMSLEEARARSLSPDHPVHRERQRENSLPDTSTATLYHTVMDISDNK